MYKWLFIVMSSFSLLRETIGQNLIVDPGAEVNPLVAWIPVNPADIWGGATWVTPHGGVYHFFPFVSTEAVGVAAELYQDINVSGNAASIDAGTASYTFTGWMDGWSAGNDKSQMIVEFQNASGVVLGVSYNTGLVRLTTWKQYTNTRTAPVGTRNIRIRLLSVMNTPSDNDGYFDDLSLVLNTPMPVELLSFSAAYTNPSATLQWTSSSEINNASFTVERSADGLSWISISSVAGAGNSSYLISYSLEDPHPLAGISYYRLKQTDYNGAVHYSAPVVLNIVSDGGLSLYPNPVADNQLHIILPSAEDPAKVLFINCLGQELNPPYTQEGKVITFHLSSFSKGVYIARLISNKGSWFKKFTVE